jgi:hypothetical protein
MDRADNALCKVIHTFSNTLETNAKLPLGFLLKYIARSSSSNTPTNATIIDLSALFPAHNPGPHLYTLWTCPVSTPSLFSMSCVCQYIQLHLLAGDRAIVTLFNDLGDQDGKAKVEARTYLVGLKKIDEKQRCVPVSFSRNEKAAISKEMDLERANSGQPDGEI